MYLSKAKDLLQAAYQDGYAEAIYAYQKDFINEKIRHSYQVLGAANFLLKHEACFNTCLPEERDYLQAVVLLHDIGRFRELLDVQRGKKFDHGVYGADLLAETQEFNRTDVILAIRHHGHLIEALYDDPAYQILSLSEQENVQRVSFLVRDADKLANFYLIARNFQEIEEVFFPKRCFEQPFEKTISRDVLTAFKACRSVNRGDVRHFADMALFFLAWIYDLNYSSSFIFMRRLGIVERLVAHFSKFWNAQDVDMFGRHIKEFVAKRCE